MKEIISSLPYDRLIGAVIIALALLINLVYTGLCLWKKRPLSSWRFFSHFFGIGSILYSFIVFSAIVFESVNKFLDLSIVYGSAGFAMMIAGLMSLGVKFDEIGSTKHKSGDE